jgi:hypothetical protein
MFSSGMGWSFGSDCPWSLESTAQLHIVELPNFGGKKEGFYPSNEKTNATKYIYPERLPSSKTDTTYIQF